MRLNPDRIFARDLRSGDVFAAPVDLGSGPLFGGPVLNSWPLSYDGVPGIPENGPAVRYNVVTDVEEDVQGLVAGTHVVHVTYEFHEAYQDNDQAFGDPAVVTLPALTVVEITVGDILKLVR